MKPIDTNVIKFPGGRGCSPAAGRGNEIADDFSAFADHIQAMADQTPQPRWTECVANELRAIASEMR